MSDQDSIFGGNPTPQTPEQATPAPAPVDPYADKLKGITNESGEQKYANVETALEALQASQQYIPSLHEKLDIQARELAEAKAELARAKGYQEAVQEFQTAPQEPVQPTPAGLDAEQARELFRQEVAAHEQARIMQKNADAVVGELTGKFGDKAEEVLLSKAKEHGMTAEAIMSLSRTSPSAVLALFGTKSDKTGADVSVRTSVYQDPDAVAEEVVLGRNTKSVLMGSTSRDVRAEFEKAKDLTAQIHAEGRTVEELSDPKLYNKYFGN